MAGLTLGPRFTPAAHEFRPRYLHLHPPLMVTCSWCGRPEEEHIPTDLHDLLVLLAPSGWVKKETGLAGVWRQLEGGRAQFVSERGPGQVEAWGMGLRYVGPLSGVVEYLRKAGAA